MRRVAVACVAAAAVVAATAQGALACASDSFKCFTQELLLLAEQRGVSRAVFERAFAGVTPDPSVLTATRIQPEYVRPIGQYLATRITPGMIGSAQREARRWSDTLARIEQEFGVAREVVVAIWGIESGFGAAKGSRDVIRSLATLAHARWRDPFFRDELLDALAILQAGDVPREHLAGSWAGAMGQPQFLPSSFLRHAVDFSGDGRRDLWSNVPDVLGSIANYLKNFGWQRGKPWGYEVVLPQTYDFRVSRGSLGEWAARGLRRADGGALAGEQQAYLLFPSGARGPAFLVLKNYEVIKSYNFSDPYALAVLHLSDRMRGQGAWRGNWPADERPLSRDDRIALQRALAALGYSVANFVGHVDFDQRDMIREMQLQAGLVADGNPTAELLDWVRRRAGKRPTHQ